MRRLLAGALLGLMFVCPTVRAQDDGLAVLRAMAAGEDDDALAEAWFALPAAERRAAIHAGLRSKEEWVVEFAAGLADLNHLSSEDMRLAGRRRAADGWWAWWMGAPELEACLAKGMPATGDLAHDLHRACRTDEIPLVVRRMETANGERFRALFEVLRILASHSSEQEADAARGFLLEEREPGAEEIAWTGPGCTPGFRLLAERAWDVPGPPGAREAALGPPPWWLLRAAHRIVPVEVDLPWLRRVTAAERLEGAIWAVRHLVRLTWERSVEELTALATTDPASPGGIAAAAWLARLGTKEPWQRLMRVREDGAGDPWLHRALRRAPGLDELLWIADREAARRHWATEMPGPLDRAEWQLLYGVTLVEEDLRAVEAIVTGPEGRLEDAVRFYSDAAPDILDTSAFAWLLQRLLRAPLDGDCLDGEDGTLPLRPLLARIEVGHPEALTLLLNRWAASDSADARELGHTIRTLLAAPQDDAARFPESAEEAEDEDRWPGVLRRAVDGDRGAVTDLRMLFEDNRTGLIDELLNCGYDRALAARREWAAWHVPRLGWNCCSRYQAVQVLRAMYPTIPVEDRWTPVLQQEFAARWIADRADRMRWSRILAGWVPAPRR